MSISVSWRDNFNTPFERNNAHNKQTGNDKTSSCEKVSFGIDIFHWNDIYLCNIPTINAEANFTSQQELQNYVEVNESELPQPVIDGVAKYFEGATINTAYKSEKGEFKLVLSAANGESHFLHANSKGEWIEKQ